MTTYLRHASRHLRQTLIDHVTAALVTGGWTGDPAPFGTTPVEIRSSRIREADLAPITGNLVAISFGDEGEDEPVELGGGLVVSSSHMFIDVVAVGDAVGLALASDIKDLLSGRAAESTRFLTLNDYTSVPTGVAVPGYQIEIPSVVRQRPQNLDYKAFWQILVAVVELTFPGAQ